MLVEKGNDLSDPEISSEISSEVEKLTSDDREITETFNKLFVRTVPTLEISPKENCKTDVRNDSKPILIYIKMSKNH